MEATVPVSPSTDAEDFDPEAGFAQPGGGDRWEGEDEGLDLTAVTETPKPEKPVKCRP